MVHADKMQIKFNPTYSITPKIMNSLSNLSPLNIKDKQNYTQDDSINHEESQTMTI